MKVKDKQIDEVTLKNQGLSETLTNLVCTLSALSTVPGAVKTAPVAVKTAPGAAKTVPAAQQRRQFQEQ